ncbi:hypothetical protein Barb7_01699 [Bacteroidales bacterium Barb7]|nr:hypothetical protein Barb7_01699 [Bacteroidales bacterium Barb7]
MYDFFNILRVLFACVPVFFYFIVRKRHGMLRHSGNSIGFSNAVSRFANGCINFCNEGHTLRGIRLRQ